MATLLDRIDGVDATIDYVSPEARVNRRFCAPGAELNTGSYNTYPVRIRNARQAPRPFTLDEHGFCLSSQPSVITDWRDAEAIRTIYAAEVVEIAKRLTGADLVVPMGGQFRSSGQTGPGVQPPAAEAHVDFNTYTANKIAARMYALGAPDGPGYDRFISFSLWRAVSPPPQSWPLALCEGGSIGAGDGASNTKVDVDELPTGDALFAPIPGEAEMTAATIFYHNPGHLWWYYPDMTPDEVIFIKFHDSNHDVAWRAPHTAFHDTSRPDANVRESMEFRAVAFFSKA